MWSWCTMDLLYHDYKTIVLVLGHGPGRPVYLDVVLVDRCTEPWSCSSRTISPGTGLVLSWSPDRVLIRADCLSV